MASSNCWMTPSSRRHPYILQIFPYKLWNHHSGQWAFNLRHATCATILYCYHPSYDHISFHSSLAFYKENGILCMLHCSWTHIGELIDQMHVRYQKLILLVIFFIILGTGTCSSLGSLSFLEKPPDLSYDCWNRHVLFGCFPFIDVDGDAKIFQHENVQDWLNELRAMARGRAKTVVRHISGLGPKLVERFFLYACQDFDVWFG